MQWRTATILDPNFSRVVWNRKPWLIDIENMVSFIEQINHLSCKQIPLDKRALRITQMIYSLNLLILHFEIVLHHLSHRFPSYPVSEHQARRPLNLLDSHRNILLFFQISDDTCNYNALFFTLDFILPFVNDTALLLLAMSLYFSNLSNL